MRPAVFTIASDVPFLDALVAGLLAQTGDDPLALARQLLLTRLVLGWGRARGSGPLTAGQAVPLARELARFLDEVQSEGCDLAQLASLAPAHYAEHWQESLAFLAILTEHWPLLLAEIGGLDPAERGNRALAAPGEGGRRPPP